MNATKPPEVARQMEYCYHCGAKLVFDGYLRYWSESRPGNGWPVQVKVCRECRGKWQEGEDDYGRQRV